MFSFTIVKNWVFILGLLDDLDSKNLPEMQEAWVYSLGQEDHLEKEMATQSSILAWRIPWTEDHSGL